MTARHKVFISFHHHGDGDCKERFLREFRGAFDDFSVGDREIDPGLPTDTVMGKIRDEYIRDATVTVVLVGRQTWQRKYVDWEIRASLRDTRSNPRTGLLGILLPTYGDPEAPPREHHDTLPPRRPFWRGTIPECLWRNVEIEYATMRPWPTTSAELQDWIHEAYRRRTGAPPTLAGDRYARNRTSTRWT